MWLLCSHLGLSVYSLKSVVAWKFKSRWVRFGESVSSGVKENQRWKRNRALGSIFLLHHLHCCQISGYFTFHVDNSLPLFPACLLVTRLFFFFLKIQDCLSYRGIQCSPKWKMHGICEMCRIIFNIHVTFLKLPSVTAVCTCVVASK